MALNNYNQVNGNAGITSAAGYTNFRDAIQDPIYSNMMIGNTYKDSVFPLITTGNFLEGLKKCGSSIGFRVEEKIVVNDYQENQTLDSQAPEMSMRWISINKAKYFNVKIDTLTLDTVCNVAELTNGFCESAGKSLKEKLDPEILLDMAGSSAIFNRGKNAGCENDIDMGDFSDPFEINPINFTQKLHQVGLLFTNSAKGGNYWEKGKMKAVLPNIARSVLHHRDSGIASYNPQTAVQEDGSERDISGWDLVYNNNVPKVNIPSVGTAYYIIFCHSDATGFVQQLHRCEVKDSEKSFGMYYRGMWVYGNGTLIPEGVAVGFFTFNTQTN
jgi:hypothetical protein